MSLLYSEFKRKFSISMYKNMKIKLGEMSFFKDFVNDTRGDLYPIAMQSANCLELVEGNRYAVLAGSVKRIFCQFFPFATYEVSYYLNDGEAGLCFRGGNGRSPGGGMEPGGRPGGYGVPAG